MSKPEVRPDTFPKFALYGAAALMLFSLSMAVYGRIAGLGSAERPAGQAMATRSLRFEDRADGAVVVSLAGGPVLDVLTGQQGFLRGTLRGFARSRRADGAGSGPPLVLTGYTDGRLTLVDPTTGRHVDLEAFGSSNEAVFARLLTISPQPHAAGGAS